MGTMRYGGIITQSMHTPLPANRIRGLIPTFGAWNYAAIGYAYLDDGGVFTDDTVDANDAGANDVALLPAAEAINDAFYFGDAYCKFSAIQINIGTAGVGGNITWEYWNGSAWAALTVADFTNEFTTAGTNDVNLVEPAEVALWSKTVVNGTDAYWVRARCTAANYAVQPLASTIALLADMITTSDDIVNITDGNWTTATGWAKATTSGASETWGWFYFDRGGAISTPLLINSKIEWAIATGATSSDLSMFIESSSLAAFTDVEQENSNCYFRGTAAEGFKVTNSLTTVIHDRYFRMRFKAFTATTVYVRVHEIAGYEMGL